LALAVNKNSAGKDPYFLDTLAAAYAENRNFKEALRISRNALKLAESSENKDLVKSLREEITLYEAGKPVRDPR
jgi:transcription elongation factor GreA-like protein